MRLTAESNLSAIVMTSLFAIGAEAAGGQDT